jgi:hypothetical protein
MIILNLFSLPFGTIIKGRFGGISEAISKGIVVMKKNHLNMAE